MIFFFFNSWQTQEAYLPLMQQNYVEMMCIRCVTNVLTVFYHSYAASHLTNLLIFWQKKLQFKEKKLKLRSGSKKVSHRERGFWKRLKLSNTHTGFYKRADWWIWPPREWRTGTEAKPTPPANAPETQRETERRFTAQFISTSFIFCRTSASPHSSWAELVLLCTFDSVITQLNYQHNHISLRQST